MNQMKIIMNQKKIKGVFNDNYVEYESNGDKDKRLSIEEYLNMIRPYLTNIIDDHKDEWKIQLTMEINFISIKDSSETHPIHMHSKNILTLTGYETGDIIEKIFDSLLEKYQERLEEKVKKSNYNFDSVGALYYKLHKTSLNRGGSYIDSPEWLKNKKRNNKPKT